jgi:hypothetical protein
MDTLFATATPTLVRDGSEWYLLRLVAVCEVAEESGCL